jgi:putative PIN family toxin of toxin-antitoxin system
VIRATVDTNVLASGLLGLTRDISVPGELLRRWHAGRFQIATSAVLLDELVRTLANPYFASRIAQADIAATLSLLRQSMVSLTHSVYGIATHPEDDLVLATALSAGSRYFVTGDRKFLDRVPQYEGVRILSPCDFLSLLDALT